MKKLFLLISLLVFLPFSVFAKTCTFTTDPKNIKVTWTAFKTPKKVAVNGTFKDIKFEGPMSGNAIDEIVKSSTFLIKADLVDTKDAARDIKVAQFFFKKMTGETVISGKVTSMDKETINLEITMNGKTVAVPMSYKIKKSKLSAKGELDILNFGMDESLKSINQACSELHEKKTWSDVGLALQATFKKSCK